MQSRRGSLIEQIAAVIIAYLVALVTQHFLYPLWNIHVGGAANAQIAFWFSVISLVRGYMVRRLFNFLTSIWSILHA